MGEDNKNLMHFYQVWVGNLPSDVSESTLRNAFRCFGPVGEIQIRHDQRNERKNRKFAYILYHNSDVAEIATKEMDGKIICNEKIHTKGPKKIIMHSSSSDSNCNHYKLYNQEKSKLDRNDQDLRPYTDCYYYALHGNCIPKVGQICQFRHVNASTKSKSICNKWESRNCFDRQCPHLHPGQKPDSVNKIPAVSNTINIKAEPVGVFWDMHNCSFPKTVCLTSMVNKIRRNFCHGKHEVDFICVSDATTEKKDILEELNNNQVNVVHVDSTVDNASTNKITSSLRKFAKTYKPPATVVLITVHNKLTSELSYLRHQKNFRVVLLYGTGASNPLLSCCHHFESFDKFIEYNTSNTRTSMGKATHEILIANLPTGPKYPIQRIKARLNSLISNSGGTLVSISQGVANSKDNVAVIRYTDIDAAKKSIQRLDKESIFGRQINATFYQNKQKSAEKNENIHQLKNLNISLPNIESNYRIDEKAFNGGMNFDFNGNTTLDSPTFMDIIPSPDVPTSPMNFFMNPNYNPFLNGSMNLSNDGIDLLFTNLNKNVGVKEIKNKLSSLVRGHSKVKSIIVSGQDEETSFHAFVKVPKLQDAHLCISKLDNQMLFGRQIRVSIPSVKNSGAFKLKSEISSILFETEQGWLSLEELLAVYKERYQKTLNVMSLDQVKDLVYVDGAPGFQFSCLLHFPVGLLRIKHVDDLQEEIIDVLAMHNKRVPLASIPGLYWSYMQKVLPLSENGNLLLHLLAHQKFTLIGTTPSQQVISYKKDNENDEELSLHCFEHDVIEMLKTSQSMSIMLNKFIPSYHQYFGCQCCVHKYGFEDVIELIEAVDGNVLTTTDGETRYLTFTPDYKHQLLNKQMQHLIEWENNNELLVNAILSSYYKFYGHKIYFRNYGHDSLASLVESLDKHLFKVVGHGESKKLILLCQRSKSKEQQLLLKFANEVSFIIQHQPNKCLNLHNLSSEYYKYYAKQLKLAELGFSKLNDLVSAISSYIEIHGSKDGKVLYLSDDSPNFEKLWADIEKLLKLSPDRAIVVLQLPNMYKDYMMKPFPLDTVKLSQFLSTPPQNIVVCGVGSNRIIIDVNFGSYPDHLLYQQVADILSFKEKFQLPIQELCDLLKEKKIVTTNNFLLHKVSQCHMFEVKKNDVIQLSETAARDQLEHEITLLLSQQPNHRISLHHFSRAYFKSFKKKLLVNEYGVTKLIALLQQLKNQLIKVDYDGKQPFVTYGALGSIYIECQSVCEDKDGAILLCNFAPEYQRKYNKQLKASDHGFQRIGDLVSNFSGIFYLYGQKNTKVVVLKERCLYPIREKKKSQSQSESDVIRNGRDEVEGNAVEVSDHEQHNESTEPPVHDIAHNRETVESESMSTSETRQETNSFDWFESFSSISTLMQAHDNSSPISSENFPYKLFDTAEQQFHSGVVKQEYACLPGEFGDFLQKSSIWPAVSPMQSTNQNNFSVNKSINNNYIEPKYEESGNYIDANNDLMRLLLGRCSPKLFSSKNTGGTQVSSTTFSGNSSDTYSCYSALEELKRKEMRCQDNLVISPVRKRCVTPRLAANFDRPFER